MFIRKKHDAKRGLTRVQIVQSRRVGGKVRQKVVRHVGSSRSDDETAALVALAQMIIGTLREGESPGLFTPKQYADLGRRHQRRRGVSRLGADVGELRETERLSVGMRHVFGHICRHFGWDSLLGARRRSSGRILLELVIARIAQPLSKRATVAALKADHKVALNLDRVYQSMDYLDDALIGRIRDSSAARSGDLLGAQQKMVFYDVTTLYFESEREDSLRRKGYSKDGKFNRVQVMLALWIDACGQPVGYQLLAGNTFEGHTLAEALDTIVAQCGKDVTVVADAAMMSKSNRALLRSASLSYVLGFSVKGAKAKLRARLTDRERFVSFCASDDDDDAASFREVAHDGHRIVATYSPRRARKDRRKRERELEKLRARLGRRGSVKGAIRDADSKYLSIVGEGSAEIDPAKVEKLARCDGIRAIIAYGAGALSAQELVSQYRKLWTIERCFRTNKHDLRMRPIYHWSPRRVEAHIAICYMAFCCVEHLRRRLEALGRPMSAGRIRRELSRLQISVLEHRKSGKKYAVPSAASPDARLICRAAGLTWQDAPFEMIAPD